MATAFRVLKGFNFSKDGLGAGHRFEPGDVYMDFPEGVDIEGLLNDEAIQEVELDADGKVVRDEVHEAPEEEVEEEEETEEESEDEELQEVTEESGEVESEVETTEEAPPVAEEAND